ncbi:hypothetical protein Ddye_029258 [Dipteronia dyeriana]|uniref:Uncharacterized protein n=1 Tax=Dipteronia dyeriana TaxID=168575 RepID=A0AAD9TEG2_9ROSI|nr:hypothetical protein Ddye_029258 [Dipteronia dyeriana]
MRNPKQLEVALLFVEIANTPAITKGVVKLSYLLETIRSNRRRRGSSTELLDGCEAQMTALRQAVDDM